MSLMKRPSTSQELVELVQYANAFKERDLPRMLLNECQTAADELHFLFECEHSVNEEVLMHIGASFGWVKKIASIIKDADNQIALERFPSASLSPSDHQRRSPSSDRFGELDRVSEYITIIRSVRDNLSAAEEEVSRINEQEELLGMSRTDFVLLSNAAQELEPFEELWTLANEFRSLHTSWVDGPVFELNAEEVKEASVRMSRQALKLSKLFNGSSNDVPADVADSIRASLDAFAPHVGLVEVLCNPGLRTRHWTLISDTVGFDMRPDDHTTLSRFIDMGVGKWLDSLSEISDAASKEYAIEKALNGMKSEWESVEFGTSPYRESGTFIVNASSVEEVQQILDDQIVKTQTMKGSSFAKAFTDEIQRWEGWLSGLQDVIDAWLKVQSTWLYLEPIFSSDDIMKQMPEEGAMFQRVDTSWRRIMAQVEAAPAARDVSAIDGLLDSLESANGLLDKIQKGLSQYLETKRLFFPRFFFLSNDELLEILAETKDPKRVQPHLKKCFEGINRLEFQDNLDITAMISPGQRCRSYASLAAETYLGHPMCCCCCCRGRTRRDEVGVEPERCRRRCRALAERRGVDDVCERAQVDTGGDGGVCDDGA